MNSVTLPPEQWNVWHCVPSGVGCHAQPCPAFHGLLSQHHQCVQFRSEIDINNGQSGIHCQHTTLLSYDHHKEQQRPHLIRFRECSFLSSSVISGVLTASNNSFLCFVSLLLTLSLLYIVVFSLQHWQTWFLLKNMKSKCSNVQKIHIHYIYMTSLQSSHVQNQPQEKLWRPHDTVYNFRVLHKF